MRNRSSKSSTAMRLDSLLVDDTLLKTELSVIDSFKNAHSEFFEGVGIHGVKAHSFGCPGSRWCESRLQNIERYE